MPLRRGFFKAAEVETVTRVAKLFPPEVITEEAVPIALADGLYEEERPFVARAVDKRFREFNAGRICARRAMQRLSVAPVALPSDTDRAPIWPLGLVGSITHTDGYCVAAVALASAIRSVGVDVEVDGAVKEELWSRICDESELAWVRAQSDWDPGRLVKLIFSAKEAFYKCQYPLTKQFLSFHEASGRFDLQRGVFSVAFLIAAGDGASRFAVGAELHGRFLLEDGLIATGVTLAHDEAP